VSKLVAEALDTSKAVRWFNTSVDAEIAASHRAFAFLRADLRRDPPTDPRDLASLIERWALGMSVYVLPDESCGGHGDLWVWSVEDVQMLECDVAACRWTIDRRPFGPVDAQALRPATRAQVEAQWPACDLLPLR
jgi:hypothetical protein